VTLVLLRFILLNMCKKIYAVEHLEKNIEHFHQWTFYIKYVNISVYYNLCVW